MLVDTGGLSAFFIIISEDLLSVRRKQSTGSTSRLPFPYRPVGYFQTEYRASMLCCGLLQYRYHRPCQTSSLRPGHRLLQHRHQPFRPASRFPFTGCLSYSICADRESPRLPAFVSLIWFEFYRLHLLLVILNAENITCSIISPVMQRL